MADLKDPRWMVAKAMLLLLCGLLAAGIVIAESPSLKTAGLIAIAIWGFCRAYYFAFYVIEHYIDREFRFAGLTSVAVYLWRNWRHKK